MSAVIYSFAEERAKRLREADTPLGRMFRELDSGHRMAGISTEQLIEWAVRLNGAKDSDTMAAVCLDIENMLEGRTNG